MANVQPTAAEDDDLSARFYLRAGGAPGQSTIYGVDSDGNGTRVENKEVAFHVIAAKMTRFWAQGKRGEGIPATSGATGTDQSIASTIMMISRGFEGRAPPFCGDA